MVIRKLSVATRFRSDSGTWLVNADREVAMGDPVVDTTQDQITEAEVSRGLEEAKELAKSLTIDDARSGQWFVAVLRKVVQAYDRNATAEYFQRKYPGLGADEIADILISVTVRYATIAGAVTGAAATANMIATLSSVGMTAALMVTAIGGEMLYLARIQMRLVLDLAVAYDIQIDAEDPEDMLMVFGYALGVAPSEMLGKGLQVAAGAGTKYAVRKYISKGTLKAIQDFGRRIGFRILQRTILKYTVPIASAVVGSSYNYVSTKSLGRIAKSHFKNRGEVTEELRLLVSRQNTYDIAFPAAAMYLAQVDGQYTAKEKEFYGALLSRMSFDDHTRNEFQKLVSSEENLLDALAAIEDVDVRSSLVEALVLMATYDGELVEEERQFLTTVSAQLNVPLDIDNVEQRAADYRIAVERSLLQKTATAAKATSSKAVDVAGQAADTVKGAASRTGDKVSGALGRVLRRRTGDEASVEAEDAITACVNCGAQVPAEYNFCPSCGQSNLREKHCVSCNEVIPVDFAFCPHCGTQQD